MWNLFYRYPRLLFLTLCLILVAGFSSLHVLPRSEDPRITGRWAWVMTRFPGADAERVESLVTEKIENELLEIEEIEKLDSTSSAEVSVIMIELEDYVSDVNEVWSRVRDELDDAAVLLPAGAQAPDFNNQNRDAFTLIVGLTWEMASPVNLAILRRQADELAHEFRVMIGTEYTKVYGDPSEEILVQVNAATLASLGLTAEDVAGAVRRTDAKVSAGLLRSGRSELLIEVEGELDSLERINQVVLRQGADGRLVRVGDVADVRKTVTDPPRDLAIISGKPGIALAIRMTPGQRIDHWASAARKKIEAFRADLPRGIGLNVLFDQSRYTEQRLNGLAANLIYGVLGVMGVMFFMMGWKPALMVGSALPLSILMVFAGMRLLGVPIHQMSVSGLIIALGLLIDNAIIMVDEVRHRSREGVNTATAIAQSVRYLSVPLLGSTLTTVLAFMPLVLMTGPAGEFVGAIGISVSLALVSSLFLAMTVVPTVTGYIDRAGAGAQKMNWWRTGFSSERLVSLYRQTLRQFFTRPVYGVGLAVLLPALGFYAGSRLEEQFFPPADRDQFHIEFRLSSESSLEQTRSRMMRVRDLLMADSRVEEVYCFVGQNVPRFYYNIIGSVKDSPSFAQAMVQLASAEGARQVIQDYQSRLQDAFPEAQVVCRQLEQGPPFQAPIELRLLGPDVERLRELGDEVRGVLAGVPDVVSVRSSLAAGRPKLWFRLNNEEARLAQLDNIGVARQLDAALEGIAGGSLIEDTEELPVRVRVVDETRRDLDRILSIDLIGNASAGQESGGRGWVPLSALGELELVPEVASIPRRNGKRCNTVQGFIKAGVLPETVLGAFRERLEESHFALPPGYSFAIGGESAERDSAVGNLMASVSVLFTLMGATLVLSFRSFRMAGIIGFVGVLSVGLGLLSIWVFGLPFGFMAIVGTMGLVGVAINDSIVVMAGLRADTKARSGDIEATIAVVLRATRHVLSTTLTTVAGFMPLWLWGGEFWTPLVVTIGGGVVGATILALFFVPSALLLVTRKKAAIVKAAVSVACPPSKNDEPPMVTSGPAVHAG